MVSRPRRIAHTFAADCACEPVQALMCECCPGWERGKADPACQKCHGFGAFRLPMGTAPRDTAAAFYICRDGKEGRYALWEGWED